MPHIIVEHTKGVSKLVSEQEIARHVHMAVVESGIFDPSAIKTRTHACDRIWWGEEAAEMDFIHVTVKILSGRDIAKRAGLSAAVFKVLQERAAPVPKLSVDIHEMDKETYSKT